MSIHLQFSAEAMKRFIAAELKVNYADPIKFQQFWGRNSVSKAHKASEDKETVESLHTIPQ